MAKMRFTRDSVADTTRRKDSQNKEGRQRGRENRRVNDVRSWKDDVTERVME